MKNRFIVVKFNLYWFPSFLFEFGRTGIIKYFIIIRLDNLLNTLIVIKCLVKRLSHFLELDWSSSNFFLFFFFSFHVLFLNDRNLVFKFLRYLFINFSRWNPIFANIAIGPQFNYSNFFFLMCIYNPIL